MAVDTTAIDAVPVSRFFLSLDNPRHVPFDNEAKTIDYLCNKEDVYQLARDIARHGLNPLERFALIPVSNHVSGVVFKEKDSVNLWLERIHSGPQRGIGRKE